MRVALKSHKINAIALNAKFWFQTQEWRGVRLVFGALQIVSTVQYCIIQDQDTIVLVLQIVCYSTASTVCTINVNLMSDNIYG